MRFGRILLASLTALAAYSYAQQTPVVRQNDVFPRLFHVVVPIFAAAAESVAAPIAKAAPQTLFALQALKATPLAGSLVLLASFIAVDLVLRRHQRQFLRC